MILEYKKIYNDSNPRRWVGEVISGTVGTKFWVRDGTRDKNESGLDGLS